MLTPTNYKIDPSVFQEACNQLPRGQMKTTINQPTGDFFYDSWILKDEYKNEDFVVLAISKDKQTQLNNNEFYNGLNNINYELCNVKHLTLDKEQKIGFILLLPLKQIYDLFLDVYNDVIFESTSYKIDYDNNECWYDNSLNDIL